MWQGCKDRRLKGQVTVITQIPFPGRKSWGPGVTQISKEASLVGLPWGAVQALQARSIAGEGELQSSAVTLRVRGSRVPHEGRGEEAFYREVLTSLVRVRQRQSCSRAKGRLL